MRQPSPVKTERRHQYMLQNVKIHRSRTISVVVDQIETLLVVQGSEMSLGYSQTNAIRETLTQGTSGNLDTIGMTRFWVTRGQRTNLTEVLQVVKGEFVAAKMEQNILQCASVLEMNAFSKRRK